jgi:hypothetical protein
VPCQAFLPGHEGVAGANSALTQAIKLSIIKIQFMNVSYIASINYSYEQRSAEQVKMTEFRFVNGVIGANPEHTAVLSFRA